MPKQFDIAVIGGGIAGASVAAHLARAGRSVALLEMESQPGYHTTGRSAAVFAPSYGPAPIRALTCASETFFRAPPHGFADSPLFSPRLIMLMARADQMDALTALEKEVRSDRTEIIAAKEIRHYNQLVRDGYADAALLDHAGQDIDVAGLHQGYLRIFRAAGGALFTNAEVTSLVQDTGWRITTRSQTLQATTIVNAAGAWADHIGKLAGAEQIGLTPKRRTAAMIAIPDGVDVAAAPITIDAEEAFYLKPDAGRLLISPADETPSAPCDAQPEEMDVAVCVDRIETAFDVQVRRIENKWAGLRSFVPDKSPVVGLSAKIPGFFWLAGQGGYGIQTAPALSETAAALVLGQNIPTHVLDAGLDVKDIAPERLN